MPEEEKCEPCEISVFGAMILSKYNGADKTELTKEFSSGKLSINQLLAKTGVSDDIVSLADSLGVSRELTLEEATKIYNRRKGVK